MTEPLPSSCCALPVVRDGEALRCSGCRRSLAVLSLTVPGMGGRRFAFRILAPEAFLEGYQAAGLDIDRSVELIPVAGGAA